MTLLALNEACRVVAAEVGMSCCNKGQSGDPEILDLARRAGVIYYLRRSPTRCAREITRMLDDIVKNP